MQLDNIDKQILKELFKNGRENLTTLNHNIFKDEKETMSHTGVKNRITKLQGAEILKIQGNVNIENLKYKGCFILLEMKNYDEIKNMINAYSECPRVFLLAHITGQYNLIMGVVGQNVDVLHRYINHCGPTNKEGILHSQIMFSTTIETPKFLPINLFSRESQECKCGNVCQSCETFLSGNCEGCGNF